MLTLPPTVQLLACTRPIDMRKSFDGLAGVVEQHLGKDAMTGHVFCFFNRRADHLRLLWWDRDGWMMVAKRLEAGRFQMPWHGKQGVGVTWEMDPRDLLLVLQGLDIRGAKRLPRWRPKHPSEGPPIDKKRM